MASVVGERDGVVVVLDGEESLEVRRASDGRTVARVGGGGEITSCDFTVKDGVIVCMIGTRQGWLYAVWMQHDHEQASGPCEAGGDNSLIGAMIGAVSGCMYDLANRGPSAGGAGHVMRVCEAEGDTVCAVQYCPPPSTTPATTATTTSTSTLQHEGAWLIARTSGQLHYFSEEELCERKDGHEGVGFCRPLGIPEAVSHGVIMGLGMAKDGRDHHMTALATLHTSTTSLMFLNRCFGYVEYIRPAQLAVVGWSSGAVHVLVLPSLAEKSTMHRDAGVECVELVSELGYHEPVVSVAAVSGCGPQESLTHLVVCLENGSVKCEGVLPNQSIASARGGVNECRSCNLPHRDAHRTRVACWRDGLFSSDPVTGTVSVTSFATGRWREVWGRAGCRAGVQALCVSHASDSLVLLLSNGAVEICPLPQSVDDVHSLSLSKGVDMKTCVKVGAGVGVPTSSIGELITAGIDATDSDLQCRAELERHLMAMDREIWWLAALLQIREGEGAHSPRAGLLGHFKRDCWLESRVAAERDPHTVHMHVCLSSRDEAALTAVQGQLLNITMRPSDLPASAGLYRHTRTTSLPMHFARSAEGLFVFETTVPVEPGSVRALEVDLSLQLTSRLQPLGVALPRHESGGHTRPGMFALTLPLGSMTVALAHVAKALVEATRGGAGGPTDPRMCLLGKDNANFFLGLPGVTIAAAASSSSSSPSLDLLTAAAEGPQRDVDAGRAVFALPAFHRGQRTLGPSDRSHLSQQRVGGTGCDEAVRVWRGGGGVRRARSSSAALAAAAHAIACQDVLDVLPASDDDDDDDGDDASGMALQGGGGLFSTSDAYSLPLPLQQTMAECGDLLAKLRDRHDGDGHGNGNGGSHEPRHAEQLSRLWRLYTTVRDAVC